MSENDQVRVRMDKFGALIDKDLPFGWGYIVLCFPFGKGGRINYCSNAERADVVRALYEFIAATKEGPWWASDRPEMWGSDLPQMEPGTQADDELIGRLRQQVAALEEENRQLKNQ